MPEWQPIVRRRCQLGAPRGGAGSPSDGRRRSQPFPKPARREPVPFSGPVPPRTSLVLVFVLILVFVLVVFVVVLILVFVLVFLFVEVVLEIVFSDFLGVLVRFGFLVVLLPVVVLVDVALVVLVGRQDAIPVGHFDGVVADEADAVVVAQILELVEFAVDLAALAAFDDLAHGYRVSGGTEPGNAADAYRLRHARQCPGTGFFFDLRRHRLDCRGGRENAEEPGSVSKSLLAIVGLGAAGCLVLSLLMQQLLDARQNQTKSPIAQALEVQFEGRLVGPVKVAEERTGEVARLRVQFCVLAGLQKPRLAEMAGATAWSLLRGTAAAPDEVLVVVDDDEHGPTERLSVPRPARSSAIGAPPRSKQPGRVPSPSQPPRPH